LTAGERTKGSGLNGSMHYQKRALEIWFQNNFIINIEKHLAMSFPSEQMRVPSTPQITSKNMTINQN
jgi:hypothetical protein